MQPTPERPCPRCQKAFHCGKNDANACWCAAVEMDAAALATLNARYLGCLCEACLRDAARIDRSASHRPNSQK